MTSGHSRRIAVVGAGSSTSALAGHLILAGNKVTKGARRPEAFTPPDYQREDIGWCVQRETHQPTRSDPTVSTVLSVRAQLLAFALTLSAAIDLAFDVFTS